MEVAVSNRVVSRSAIGRFSRACEDAGRETVEEAIKQGAKLSRSMAPTGTKHDTRTIPLRDSIEPKMLSGNSGIWKATARHALPIEFGAAPHVMYGSPYFHFFWDNAGRWWKPGLMGDRDIINHPGNAPQPYLRPAYEVIMSRIMQIARSKYPG